MQVQSVTSNPYSMQQPNFKSKFPVYHWHKPADEYFVTFDMRTVQRYQKILMKILNTLIFDHSNPPKTFLERVNDYVFQWDKDYKNFPKENSLTDFPFVKSAYDRRGGYKTAYNGNIYEVKPMAYLMTGDDAVNYEVLYSKPIPRAYKIARQYDDKVLKENEVKEAKMSYGYGGIAYAKDMDKRLLHPVTKKPVELHTVFKINPKTNYPTLIKLEFFETGGKDNPFVKNGIL